jgi:UDP-2,3-diacylglucosamine pyrophosphatase LpxH
MKRILLSDAHLTGLDDPNQGILVDFLRQVDADEIYFLGDIFHFWWGRRGHRDSNYEPFLSVLEELSRAGKSLFWVRGNHDFRLGPLIEEEIGVTVSDAISVHFLGRSTLLVHGDEADRSFGYRLTKKVLRGPAFAGLMSVLGPRYGDRFGRALAGASRHGSGGDTALLSAQSRWAEEQFAQGVELVVLGHSHAPGIHKLPGGMLINLGDFADAYSFLEIEESLALRTWNAALGECHTIQEERVF